MKKLVSILLTVTIFVAMFIPVAAMAASQSFSLNVQCTDENGPLSYYPTKVWKNTSISRLYVYHTAVGTSNSFNNLFHAQRGTSVGINGISSGYKWCTPNMYVPIQSSAIYSGYYYGLACRGNTKYNQYEGLQYFTVTGRYDPNYIP